MAGELLARVAARFTGSPLLTTRPGPAGELALIGADESWSVLVVEHGTGDAHAAVFLARICDERGIDPLTVLRLAGQMGAGALALVGTSYVVRFVVPAAQIATAQLDRIVLYVRDVANTLGPVLAARDAAATAAAASAVAHLAT